LDILHTVLTVLKDWLGLLAPFFLVFGVIWKMWLKKRYDDGRELYKKINVIAEEFRPNGGSTLRDAINRIEAKVTIQEQKTIALIKSLPLGTWVSDDKGKCVDVNKSLCKIMGRTESEIKGDNWSNWIHPDERDHIFREWERCVENDLTFDMEYRYIKSDARVQKVHGVAYQLRDVNDKIIGFLGTLTAIGNPA